MTTGAEYREKASEAFKKEAESFERCDTDGFVSQWCHQLEGNKNLDAAEIADNGGKWTFKGLYHRASGLRVKAKIVRVYCKFSYSRVPKWIVLDSNDDAVLWLPAYKSTKRAKLWKEGFEERDEEAPAKATIAGSGKGLSGLATCRSIKVRTDGGYPDDAVPYDKLSDEEPEPEKPGPKVGDVLYSSWGYNMTINDFVKVVSVSKTGKTITCVMIGAKTVDGHIYGPGGGQVQADPDMVLDRPEFRLHVRMNSDGTWYCRGSYPFCHGSKRMGTFWKDSGGGHYENHWD